MCGKPGSVMLSGRVSEFLLVEAPSPTGRPSRIRCRVVAEALCRKCVCDPGWERGALHSLFERRENGSGKMKI